MKKALKVFNHIIHTDLSPMTFSKINMNGSGSVARWGINEQGDVFNHDKALYTYRLWKSTAYTPLTEQMIDDAVDALKYLAKNPK